MTKRLTLTIFFILFSAIFLCAGTAEKAQAEVDPAFIAATFENYSLPSAVQTLIQKNIPMPVIISEAQKAGHRDARITAALIQTELPADQVVMECMLSHMSARKVLAGLEKHDMPPETVLDILIKNKLDTNRILATCEYMLDRGYTKAALVESLTGAGADRNIIIKAARQFDIPPATTVEAYEEVQGEPGQFGHVYTRNSLPRPALIAVGVARIHNSDAFKERDPLSPKKP